MISNANPPTPTMSATLRPPHFANRLALPLVREGDEPDLSVVSPAFNEADNVGAFHAELVQALEPLGLRWELLLVDDGSSDGTWAEILRLHDQDPRVKGLRLSRNFGHQNALFSGMSQAAGRAVVTMDVDLQHPPDIVPTLVAKWREGHQIVNTVRHDGVVLPFFKRVTSHLYYQLHGLLSGTGIASGMADFRLLDRQVVDSLLQFGEEGLFLRGLVHWLGYSACSVSFVSRSRHSGTTKYTLRKMMRLAWAGITSFSTIPLRIGIFLGLFTSVVAFSGICYAVLSYLFHTAVPGWASVVFIVSFLFGVLFILLGIMGEYIGRILIEVRRRPRFLVRDAVGLSDITSDRH